MSRKVGRAVQSEGVNSARDENGRAHSIGWGFFVALIALTPVLLGVMPPQFGPIAMWRGFDPIDLPKTVAILALAGLSLSALSVSVIRGESELQWHPVLSILAGLFGWSVVSTLFSTSLALSIWGASNSNEGLVAIFGYVLVAFLSIQYVRSTHALRTVAVTAVVAGSLVSVYAVLQLWGINPLPFNGDGGRVFSTYGNPDMLGTYLVFPLTLALGLALSSARGWRRAASWFATALIAVALIATQTRGAWIGALAAITYVVLGVWGTKWHASREKKVAAGGLVAATLLAIAAAIVAVRPKHAGSATTLASLLARLSNGRTVIWLTGLRGWLAHPITGWGPDGFGRAFESAVGPDWYTLIEGLRAALNAHSFPVQALVTLGVPGLALTVWALGYTLAASLEGLRRAKGPGRVLLVAVWAAFVGMIVGLAFGVTMPPVTVWLWLAAGLVLAPVTRRVSRTVPKAALGLAAVLGVVLAAWAGSWVVADTIVGHAMQLAPGPLQVSELQSASRLNPLAANYRWLAADAIVNVALAQQRGGQGAQAVDATMLSAIAAFDAAANADRGDALLRTEYANVLVGYAARHPATDAAQRAVQVAQEAAALAPRNPAVLGALAKAYQVAGRLSDAESAARLARLIAPAYAAQTLGSLGLDATATPTP